MSQNSKNAKNCPKSGQKKSLKIKRLFYLAKSYVDYVISLDGKNGKKVVEIAILIKKVVEDTL